MRSAALASLLALLPAGIVQAQARQPLRGSAELADGKPWPNATVALLSRPVPADERIGEPDLVQARTDEQGRFDALLLPARHYAAWACEILDDGTHRASLAAEEVTGGQPLVLVALAPRPPARVRVDGLAPWRERGRIELRSLSRTTNRVVVPLSMPDGNEVVLPPMPGRRAALELTCDGMPLLPWPTDIDLSTKEVRSVAVWAPRPTLLRFVDHKTGKPIAGARLLQATVDPWAHQRSIESDLGSSDADGYVIATLPIGGGNDFGWVNYWVRTVATGYAPQGCITQLDVPKTHDAARARAAGEAVHVFGLEPSVAVRGAITRRRSPRPGLDLLVQTHLRGSEERSGWGDRSLIVRSDDGGRFAVDLDPRFPSVFTAVLAESDLVALGGSLRFDLHPVAVLAVVSARAAGPIERNIELHDLRPLDLRVLSPEGAPARAPALAVGLGTGEPGMLLRRVATDHVGGVRVILPAIDSVVVAAWSDEDTIVQRVDITKAGGDPVELRLTAARFLRGSVRDQTGAPVAHSALRFFVSGDADGELGVLAAAMHPLRVPTDDAGEFALPLVAGMHYSLTHVATADHDHYPDQRPEFTAGVDEPERLDIVIRR